VTKAELLDAVWPEAVVEEANLAAQVSALRRLIGGGAIATIPGRGYRFVAAVDAQAPASAGDTGPQSSPLAVEPPMPVDARRAGLPRDASALIGRDEDRAGARTRMRAARRRALDRPRARDARRRRVAGCGAGLRVIKTYKSRRRAAASAEYSRGASSAAPPPSAVGRYPRRHGLLDERDQVGHVRRLQAQRFVDLDAEGALDDEH